VGTVVGVHLHVPICTVLFADSYLFNKLGCVRVCAGGKAARTHLTPNY